MRRSSYLCLVLGLLLCTSSSFAALPGDLQAPDNQEKTYHYSQNIDAGCIFMFSNNVGGFGWDYGNVFNREAGTFYPYSTVDDIVSGELDDYVLYAAGLWIGAQVNGDTRVTATEYWHDYVPGPMQGGTFLPDNPAFRVYKLYSDSLGDNPNMDYLQWPVDQGAPTDGQGNPIMIGDQMLWTVYNDADPDRHWSRPGSTPPLGLEIQQTVWAYDEPGTDTVWAPNPVAGIPGGALQALIDVYVDDPYALTGDDYQVEVYEDPIIGPAWRFVNVTTGTILLNDQTSFDQYDDFQAAEGLMPVVTARVTGFSQFEVIANGAGPLDPPEPGALAYQFFPTPGGNDPSDAQQVGAGKWAFHVADNGGSSGGGTRGSFDAFVDRVTRYGGNDEDIGHNDFEMRFTGSYANPGVGGSYAFDYFIGDYVYWVPFELWCIGEGTPDDPSDDYRMIPISIDQVGNQLYNLESWGTGSFGGGYYEHSASPEDDDPFTDIMYWYKPADTSAGESGYLAAEASMLAGTFEYDFDLLVGEETLARTVLINWNGGVSPPFNQDLPEQGTVFRISTFKSFQPQTYSFTGPTSVPFVVTSEESSSIYIKYKFYNRGENVLENCYLAL